MAGRRSRFLCLIAITAALLVLIGDSPRAQRAPVSRAPSAQGQTGAPSSPSPALQNLSSIPAGALSPRNASYSIDVRLDPETRRMTGHQVMTWRNTAPISTSELRFHLYYNAWRNSGSTWMRERLAAGQSRLLDRPERDWGWIDVTAIRLLGAGSSPPIDLTSRRTYVAPDDGNQDDRTVLSLPLGRSIAPGETINVEIEWTSQIPRPFARTGVIDRFFFIAQWFPKIGVLQADGWNCHQFHAGTEFFADYGVYDVRMTVPRGWTLGATGVERERRDNTDGTTTHRYYQQDVHDFAWTTSPNYIERVQRFEHPTLPAADMRLLLQPEHAGLADIYFDATRAALKYYGEWFAPYPYGHITIVDPAWQSAAGGMEYPTLITGGARWLSPKATGDPEDVTVHEAGHQWWYGIVATNEFEHAWMDEGINTFTTARTLAEAFPPAALELRFFGGFIPWVFRDIPLARATDGNRLNGYRNAAESDAQDTPSFRYWPSTGGLITYNKTALWMNTLERYLGWPSVQRMLATYYERWKFRHPGPEDFFAVANEVSKQDLTWFFAQVYHSSNVFDYGVQDLTSRPDGLRGFVERDTGLAFEDRKSQQRYRTDVVVRRYGEAVFPVDVVVTFAGGERVRERWDGKDRWKQYSYIRPVPATVAQVDPDRVLLLDVNYTNNSRTLEPRAREASNKWAAKWMIWLQDLLMTYAFFV